MTTVDANVATVLQSLEAHTGLAGRTIVVLHGDHGFNLGEQNRWGKQGTQPMPRMRPTWPLWANQLSQQPDWPRVSGA